MPISKQQYEYAKLRAIDYFNKASIVVKEEGKNNIEVTDFGLGMLEQIGVELITYINTD